jgi:hypothetical protein
MDMLGASRFAGWTVYDMHTFCIYGMWDLDMAPMTRLDTVPNEGRADVRYGRRSVFTALTYLTVMSGCMGLQDAFILITTCCYLSLRMMLA